MQHIQIKISACLMGKLFHFKHQTLLLHALSMHLVHNERNCKNKDESEVKPILGFHYKSNCAGLYPMTEQPKSLISYFQHEFGSLLKELHKKMFHKFEINQVQLWWATTPLQIKLLAFLR